MEAKEMFKLCYGGNKNAMSDNIIGYKKFKNYAFEISAGRSLENDNKPIYAVTTIKAEGTEFKPQHDLFKTFESLEKAEQYTKELKSKITDIEEDKEREEYEKPIIEELKEILDKTNKKVYCVLRKVSSSGMYRHISFFVVVENEPISLDRFIIKLGLGDSKDEGVGVGGCGMDMGFSVVYNLSSKIYRGKEREGYILKHEWI